MDGFFLVQGGTIQAADDRTKNYLSRCGEGEILTVTIHADKKCRDLVRHNQFFLILSRAVQSMDYEINCNADIERAVDDLIIKLKYAAGFTADIIGIDGLPRTIPRSIAFSDCTEQDAEEFRIKAYNLLCAVLKVTRKELFDM